MLRVFAQRSALPALGEYFLEHFGRLAPGDLRLLCLRVHQPVDLFFERHQADAFLGVEFEHFREKRLEGERVADAGEAVDEGVVVDGRVCVVVVAEHGLQSDHFEQQHSDRENIGLRRDVRIVVHLLQFLRSPKNTFSSSGAKYMSLSLHGSPFSLRYSRL